MNRPRIRYAASIVNTICTLNCKYCLTRTPYQMNPRNFKTENIIRDTDSVFEIYEHMIHLDFQGGEPLLHPDIARIVEHALTYVERGQIDEVRLLTNGTRLPSYNLLDVIRSKSFFFIVDDYGSELSPLTSEIANLLDSNGIRYRINAYAGEAQRFGGWIDLGDLSFKNYSPEKLLWLAENCNHMKQIVDIKDGKVFVCDTQMTSKDIERPKDEYIDLRDKSIPLAEKIRIANTFQTKPINHCKYCDGLVTESSKRVPAAEQLPRITNEMRICI